VSLNRWKFLREHVGEGKFYQELALRHINFDRGDQMLDSLDSFLREVIGLKYVISASKLTKYKSSELMAKAFKCLGVIEDDDKSCDEYDPDNFSSRGDDVLKLTEGTIVEPE